MIGPNTQQLDVRQLKVYSSLQQLLPNLTYQQFTDLLNSIDIDLTVPFRVDQTYPQPSLIVNIGAQIVTNPVSSRSRSSSFVNNNIPIFAGGSATLPSTSGGNVTTSTGGSAVMTCPTGNYCPVLLSIDQFSNIVPTVGAFNASLASIIVPMPPLNMLPFAYIVAHNSGGFIDNVLQSSIVQLLNIPTGNGANVVGFAQEVPLTIGTTTQVVMFPSVLAGVGYVVNAAMVNTTDALPEFQPVVITNKTANSFTVTWNNPLDSSNYKLDYIVPAVQSQLAEVAIGLNQTQVNVTLTIPLLSTAYVVTAQLVDVVDGLPQFQPVTITNKTTTSFTAKWNNPTNTANYRLAYNAAVFQ